MNIQEQNRWWVEKEVPKGLVPETRRKLFAEISSGLARRQLQVIAGLRRTGKSTIMFQLIDELIRRGTRPLSILYCSFDEPELQEKKVEDILRDYGNLTGIDYRKEPIFLFFDEVQKAKSWVASVKQVYDNLTNVKIVASGSASFSLMSDAKESLAGRAVYHELPPLSFEEFLHMKGVKFEPERLGIYSTTLEREFYQFVKRPFPELVHEEDDAFIKNYIKSAVIDPVILKDIPKKFREADVLLLEALVRIFYSQPGQYLNFEELAKELGRAKKTLYKALFYLELSLLIRKVHNFRPSIRAASRKLTRAYPYHPALALPYGITEESFAEGIVIANLGVLFYWREHNKEIDALYGSTPVEVKFKSKIDKGDTKWLFYFMKKYGKKLGTQEAYIITRDFEGRSDGVSFLPLWKFCLKGLG